MIFADFGKYVCNSGEIIFDKLYLINNKLFAHLYNKPHSDVIHNKKKYQDFTNAEFA